MAVGSARTPSEIRDDFKRAVWWAMWWCPKWARDELLRLFDENGEAMRREGRGDVDLKWSGSLGVGDRAPLRGPVRSVDGDGG